MALASKNLAPVRTCTSPDALSWSNWRALTPDAENPTASSLLWLGTGQRWIELDSLSDETYRLPFAFINPGVSLPPKASSRKAEDNRPRVVSPVEWGCLDRDKQRGNKSSFAPSPTSSADGPISDYPPWIRALWAFHGNANGWADVGYNFLFAPDGTIFEGLAGSDNVIGAHFSCQNTGTLGVSFLRNFMRQPATPEACFSLEQLFRWQAARIGLHPLGGGLHADSRLTMPRISSHRDGNPSSANTPTASSPIGNPPASGIRPPVDPSPPRSLLARRRSHRNRRIPRAARRRGTRLARIRTPFRPRPPLRHLARNRPPPPTPIKKGPATASTTANGAPCANLTASTASGSADRFPSPTTAVPNSASASIPATPLSIHSTGGNSTTCKLPRTNGTDEKTPSFSPRKPTTGNAAPPAPNPPPRSSPVTPPNPATAPTRRQSRPRCEGPHAPPHRQ